MTKLFRLAICILPVYAILTLYSMRSHSESFYTVFSKSGVDFCVVYGVENSYVTYMVIQAIDEKRSSNPKVIRVTSVNSGNYSASAVILPNNKKLLLPLKQGEVIQIFEGKQLVGSFNGKLSVQEMENQLFKRADINLLSIQSINKHMEKISQLKN